MIKKILFFFLLGGILTANAQFRIKGGVNFNELAGKNVPKFIKSDIGFHIGASYEFDFEYFGIEPGLFYDTRGFKISEETTILGQTFKAEAITKVNFVTLPILFKGKIPLGSGNIFIQAGPFAGVGVSAKQTGEVIVPLVGKKKVELDIKFGDKEDEYRPEMVGLSFGGGIEIGHFMLYANYDLELTDSQKNSEMHFNAIKIGAGVKF